MFSPFSGKHDGEDVYVPHHYSKEDHHPGPRYDEEGDGADDDESLTIVLRRSITLALCQAAVGAVPESLLKVPHWTGRPGEVGPHNSIG